MPKTPVEVFPAMEALPGVLHGFTQRAAGIDVKVDRDEALRRLDDAHAQVREAMGLSVKRFITARQVHGNDVAVVNERVTGCIPDVDGLITATPGTCLGIYVADCCAVYLVEPERRVIGLLHSGRKGTEQGITTVAIRKMVEEFGCDPDRIVAQLSPCIRPPHYEVDFAAQIVEQCRAAGVGQVHDSATCTACDLERYYSYRAELGKTGRMLALLAI